MSCDEHDVKYSLLVDNLFEFNIFTSENDFIVNLKNIH